MSLPSGFPEIDFEKALNKEQFSAVGAPFGPALVLAGAGSGKTRTLTYRVAWLLSQGAAPWQIMLLTFTNKAAREMLERVELLTGVEARQFWGGTFHHIGQKLLRKHGELIKIPPTFTIMDQSEAESLLNEAVKGAGGAGFLRDKANPKVPLIANIVSFARNTLKPLSEVVRARYPHLEDKIDPLGKFAAHYEALKRSRGMCDYDDLLELPYVLLRENPALAEELSGKFQHLLVDEYQDTNALQSALVDQLGTHHQIMAVGDDAQCIYTWRGAQVENILSFPERHPGTRIFKIELNYRSTPPILELANSVFSQAHDKFEKTLRPVRQGSAKPQIAPVVDGRAQAQWVVKKVRELQDAGRELSEMAVLYRSHFHAMELQLELTRLGMPFAITSGMRFFEQAHVKDLVSQLRFVFNPKDSAAFCRLACLLPKIGEVTSLKLHADVLSLHLHAQMGLGEAMKSDRVLGRVGEARRDEWLGLSETILELEKSLKEGELPAQTTRRAIEGWYSGYIKTLYPNWDSRLEDLQSLESFANRFDNFAEYLSQLVLLNSEASERGSEPEEEALRLSTVHQAKGLEWPVVFVIGLSEGMFPSRRAVEEGNIDEERRLFYVAATRAQDELYLLYPLLNMAARAGTYQQLPSRFLEQLPQDAFELVKTGGEYQGNRYYNGGPRSGKPGVWGSSPNRHPSLEGGDRGRGEAWQQRENQAWEKKTTGGAPKSVGFSKTQGVYDDLEYEKQFDQKTKENAKKLFKE